MIKKKQKKNKTTKTVVFGMFWFSFSHYKNGKLIFLETHTVEWFGWVKNKWNRTRINRKRIEEKCINSTKK